MKRRAVISRAAAAVGTLAASSLAQPTVAAKAPADSETGGAVTLEQALARRRSVRSYSTAPVSLASVLQLLWAAQGTSTADGKRTAPSAGALYPLELHLVASRVEGLVAGVHRYVPATHSLRLSAAEPSAQTLLHAASPQRAVGDAAAVLVIAAVEERTARKYGARAGRYVAFEAGAAAQNLALQAAALGLGSVVIGAFDDAAVAATLRLSPGERPLALMPIGRPA